MAEHMTPVVAKVLPEEKAAFAAAVGPMPSSVARRKSSTFSLLYMRTSSPDRPAVQLSVRTPNWPFLRLNRNYLTATALSVFLAAGLLACEQPD